MATALRIISKFVSICKEVGDVWVGCVESENASIDEAGVGEVVVVSLGVDVGVGVTVGLWVGDTLAVGFGVS